MTVKQPDGSAGLLSKGQFGDAMINELKGLALEKEIEKAITSDDQVRGLDPPVMEYGGDLMTLE